MITLIKETSSHKLVKDSVRTFDVSISLSPQSQPLELHFSDADSMLEFLHRVTADDGEQFVVSLLSYNNPQ